MISIITRVPAYIADGWTVEFSESANHPRRPNRCVRMHKRIQGRIVHASGTDPDLELALRNAMSTADEIDRRQRDLVDHEAPPQPAREWWTSLPHVGKQGPFPSDVEAWASVMKNGEPLRGAYVWPTAKL